MNVFFGKAMLMANRVFDCKKHTNIKRRASYRRIGGGRYYKGIAKHKSEKFRRKQALELQSQGYTLTRIALLLGVSRRTIHRDLRKLRPCTEAKFNRFRWDDAEFANLSMKDLIKLVKGYREVTRKARLRAQTKMLTVRVDVEAALGGCRNSWVSFSPRLPADLAGGGKIAFELNVRGHVFEVARLYAKVPSKGLLILETNLSKDPISNPPLELEKLDLANKEITSDSAKIRQLAQIQHKMFRFQNPWRMQEFLNLAPEQQDQLLQQYSELCSQNSKLNKAKTLTITLNVDHAVNSAYAATFKPHLPVALGYYSKIMLKLQSAKEILHLRTLQVTDIDYDIANFE